MMVKIILLFLTLLMLVGCSSETQEPATPAATPAATPIMTFVSYHREFPDQPDSLARGNDHRVWRHGRAMTRQEEGPEHLRGVGITFITRGPEAWAVRLGTGKAVHYVSPDKDLVNVIPVFNDSKSEALQTLEIGFEQEFFNKGGATRLVDMIVDSVDCEVYQMSFDYTDSTGAGTSVATLYVRKTNKTPWQCSIAGDALDYTVHYDIYQPSLPFDSTLFYPPDGFEIVEAGGK